MRTTVRLLVVSLAFAGLVFASVPFQPVEAQSGWAPYDDFNAKRINEVRWDGMQFEPLPDATRPTYEVATEQANGRLKMELRTYGAPGVSPEVYQVRVLALEMNGAQAATTRGIQARAKIEDLAINGCDSVGADLHAWLFRIGYNPDPSDLTNAVVATIGFRRFQLPTNTLRVLSRVRVCGNSDCTSLDDVHRVFFTDVPLRTDVTVGLYWDASAQTITFFKNSEEAIYYYPAGWQVTTSNTRLRKEIRIFEQSEACGSLLLGSWMKATFDDFKIRQ